MRHSAFPFVLLHDLTILSIIEQSAIECGISGCLGWAKNMITMIVDMMVILLWLNGSVHTVIVRLVHHAGCAR